MLKLLSRLYLLLLPFQIYNAFKWITIPGTAFAAFMLLGFLEIGQEMYVSQKSVVCDVQKLISDI